MGAGVVASGTGSTKTITIAGGSDGVTVQDEGSALSTTGTTLNFVGAGVATDLVLVQQKQLRLVVVVVLLLLMILLLVICCNYRNIFW